MLKGLSNVVIKELKELLRDPKILIGMIIVPLVMFPILGFVIRSSMESTEERLQKLQLGVLDFDEDIIAQNLTTFLETFLNITIIDIYASNTSEAIKILQTETNATDLLVIPSGFTINISKGEPENYPAFVEVYSVFSGTGGFVEMAGSSAIIEYLGFFKRTLQSSFTKGVSAEMLRV